MSQMHIAKGTVQHFTYKRTGASYWRVLITLCDGHRMWLPPHFKTEDAARAFLESQSVEVRRTGLTLATFMSAVATGAAVDMDTWFPRHFEARDARGKHTQTDRLIYKKWWSAEIGKLLVTAPLSVLRPRLEEVRDDLNDLVRIHNNDMTGRAGIAGSTALGIWTVGTTAGFVMSSAERRSGLRVRDDNPWDGIAAPEKSPEKAKAILYPHEFEKLITCNNVPIESRITYAFLCYSYLRPGEARVLVPSDIDPVSQYINVIRAWNYERKCDKPTKKENTRGVPIEATLQPLVELLVKRARATGGVLLPYLSQIEPSHFSAIFRRHLRIAQVDREALYTSGLTKLPIRMRQLRDTGITWRIARGDRPFIVKGHAGHSKFETTEGYIVDAQLLCDAKGAWNSACGIPFAPLPERLFQALYN